ncbi:MAG: T9SS type A sorting domain-containing protein, partial [Bacteroidota bacterium]
QSGGDRDITLPEPGTVFRIESSRQAASLSASEPEAALELEVRPNPTTGGASVGYRLGEPGRVRLRVVDMLGREVAVLVDEDVEAGTHRAGLGAGLAPGTYVVVLDTEADRVSRLITVVR